MKPSPTKKLNKWKAFAFCALPFLVCPEPLIAKEIPPPRHEAPAQPAPRSGRAHDKLITQNIREELQSEESLSQVARNVNILTIRGIVTLRGAVASSEERDRVESIAKEVSGTQQVKSQLRVASGR